MDLFQSILEELHERRIFFVVVHDALAVAVLVFDAIGRIREYHSCPVLAQQAIV